MRVSRSLHVAIDMQRVFAEETPWRVDTLEAVVDPIGGLAKAMPTRTHFAQFRTPETPGDAQGCWRPYYERWRTVTAAAVGDAMFEVVPSLDGLAAAGSRFSKRGYSIFSNARWEAQLIGSETDTLIVTGVETDICVLASVFDAIDRGYQVVIPVDAVTSSSLEAHRATLDHILPRLAEQVELTTVARLLARLRP